MKISKVGHVKSAVGKGRSNEKKEYFGGILYADPSRKGLEDLRKRFDTLNQRAQNLYRIFNQVQPGKRPSENASEEKKNNYERRERYAKILNGYTGLEKYLEEILFDKQEREGRNSKRFFVRIIRTTDTDTVLGTVRDKAPQIQRNRDKPENADDVDNLVSLYLRKSLKIAAPGISEMVKLLYGFKKGTEADKGAIAFFLTALEEDFTKKEFSERIASSIQNQNLPIQPARRVEKSESGAGDHVLGLVVPLQKRSFLNESHPPYLSLIHI